LYIKRKTERKKEGKKGKKEGRKEGRKRRNPDLSSHRTERAQLRANVETHTQLQ
jgi:hypothetical protein